MKKLLIITIAVALVGCATHAGTTAVIGGTIGYLLGNANRPQITQPAPIIIQEPIYIYNQCDQYPSYNERVACTRGTQQRRFEDEQRRNSDAYNLGYRR